MKFKVGDKVVLINNKFTGFEIGSKGKIVEADGHRGTYLVEFRDQKCFGTLHYGSYYQTLTKKCIISIDICKSKLWKALA